MVQLSLAPATNQNLFSRHYLEERLPESQVWSEEEEEARAAWERLQEIYDDQKEELPERKNNEEGLRQKFITPILEDVLGYALEKEQTAQGSLTPDYVLFESEKKRKSALSEDDPFGNSIGLLEAKAWEKKLERRKKGGGQLYDPLNPTVQVMEYLFNTDARWGIITNGKRWRIYHQEASAKLDTYFEINIITILENDNFKQFRYFYFLFRKSAFTGEPGDAYIDSVRKESNTYAEKVGAGLEKNVYQALEWLAKGFLNVSTNNLDTEEDLKQIHDESLIFLYRLLFLFYTDSRGVMDDPAEAGYEWYSFRWLVHDKVLKELEQREVAEEATEYWVRLNQIFETVNKGSKEQELEGVEIPAYNGKLFSREEHPFLAENQIQNKYLAKVIALLARTAEGTSVDYADLSVRHLGGIYEGLLEYQLVKAEEKKIVEDGEWIPVTEADASFEDKAEDMRVDEGDVYLETDEGERKVTGSYYTPDYVVQYIVENTIDPQIDEIIESSDDDEEIRDRILDLDVLDPAMGSGHFLVGAIDHIAARLLPYTEKDIQDVKRDVARRCVYGVDVNPLATELAKVSIWLNTVSSDKPLSFLDHHLKTGNSLVGADVFDLDTHPTEESKDGEDEDNGAPGQLKLADKFGGEDDGQAIQDNIQQLLQMYLNIMDMPENQPNDIHEQEEIYHEFRDHKFRRRFDALADVYTSYWFGNEYSKEQYSDLLDAFQPGSERWEEVIQQDWVRKATDAVENAASDNLSDRKQFFHWKLEFPEVFFDIKNGNEQENPGFDAVVGNPPYINSKHLKQDTKEYLEETYCSPTERWDIYAPFVELGDQLSASGLSYILPSMFFRRPYGKGLREYIGTNSRVKEIMDLSEMEVFPGATNYVSILTLNHDAENSFRVYTPENKRDIEKKEDVDFYTLKNSELGEDAWDIIPPQVQNLMEKTPSDFVTLDDLTVSITEGIHTGKDEVFILEKSEVDSLNLEQDIIKPLAKAEHINRYKPIHTDIRVLYPYQEDDVIPPEELKAQYPNTWDYLKKNEEKLKSRTYLVNSGYRWYELWRKREHAIYENPKILTPEITDKSNFTLDEGKPQHFINTRSKSIRVENSAEIDYLTLLGLLNSKLLEFIYRGVSPPKRGGYREYKTGFLSRLKIPDRKIDGIKDKSRKILDLEAKRDKLNLKLNDHLLISEDANFNGETLGDLYSPPSGVADTILTATAEDKTKLQIENIKFQGENPLKLYIVARYKPEEDEDAYETDQYGYTETDLIPAMEFHDMSEMQAALVKEFVPVAVDEAGGFANFRETATKTKSLIDRLEALTLPKLDDVGDGLKKYLDVKERADELDRKIEKTDELIDQIVYDLYGLDEDEIEVVEEAVSS